MNDNYERNAHFQDSARQVSYKILDLAPGARSVYSWDDRKLIAEIIAQYAYDLAKYVAIQAMIYYGEDPDVIISHIPDLTEWPTP